MSRIFKKIKIGDFGKVLIRFESSQVISNFMRLVAGFFVVSMLDPEQYGRQHASSAFAVTFLIGSITALFSLYTQYSTSD